MFKKQLINIPVNVNDYDLNTNLNGFKISRYLDHFLVKTTLLVFI